MALRAAFQTLTGWQRLLAAAMAGAVSALSMAPFHLAGVLLVSLPVLVWLIEPTAGATTRGNVRTAAISGWWFGFGYHLTGLYWIGEAFLVEADKFAPLLPFAVTLMPAGLALFHALASGAAAATGRRGVELMLVLAVALAMSEWLRGHVLTGFPWNTLGYALTGPTVLMQSASLLGIYALTAVTVVALACPLVAIEDTDAGGIGRRAAIAATAGLVPLGLLLAYGAYRLSLPEPDAYAGARLRLVQPSIPQRQKWRPDKQREIFERHLTLSVAGEDGGQPGLAGITHLVWPEASMPFLPLASPEALDAIARTLPDGTRLMAGALRTENNRRPTPGADRPRAFNSLIVLGAGARLEGVYDKIHLVPFGEYLPMQATLEAIGLEQLTRWRGGFSTGPAPRPLLNIDGLPPIGVLICYEAVFPGAVVQGAERPGALLNVTNDGWFGHTTGPYQHLHQARVRAVEEGLPLLRSANNGISAVIDARGRIVAALALDEQGVIDTHLPGALPPPPYARHGDLALLAVCGLFAGIVVAGRRRQAHA